MRLGNWQFTPGVIPTLLALVVLFALVRLGFWQLHRADYKRGLIHDFNVTSNRHPVPFTQLATQTDMGRSRRFVRVTLSGRYDSRHQFLLDEMQHAGRVGFYVLTPFHSVSNGRTVLINRGWIPAHGARRPQVDLQISSRQRDIRGMLGKLPVPGVRVGAAETIAGRWPRIMLYPTLENLEAAYGKPLFARPVLLDPHTPGGFVRDWRPVIGLSPARHIAYAIQWFALALTLIVIWLVANCHRRVPKARST